MDKLMKTAHLVGALALVCGACSTPDNRHETQPAQVAAHASPKEPAPIAAAHPPAKPSPAVKPSPGAGASTSPAAKPASPSLAFQAQPGWKTEAPSSAMRKAQYSLPHAETDTEDANLIVYYFGSGGGGSKEANIERWAGQFTQPDGRDSAEALESSTRKVNGLDVYDVELAGTYVAETAPGSGVRVNKDGWHMLASIIDTPHGAYYVKLVGPNATIAHWATSYRAFVSSATLAP
jgi:hypothetical protein